MSWWTYLTHFDFRHLIIYRLATYISLIFSLLLVFAKWWRKYSCFSINNSLICSSFIIFYSSIFFSRFSSTVWRMPICWRNNLTFVFFFFWERSFFAKVRPEISCFAVILVSVPSFFMTDLTFILFIVKRSLSLVIQWFLVLLEFQLIAGIFRVETPEVIVIWVWLTEGIYVVFRWFWSMFWVDS